MQFKSQHLAVHVGQDGTYAVNIRRKFFHMLCTVKVKRID